MIILGLTGSIGTGKSTTTAMFAHQGIPVHDADAVVHALYEGEAASLVEAAFPGTTVDGKVDRARLSAELARNPAQFKELETIIHPLVRARTQQFLAENLARDTPLVVLDIPLLYETGAEACADKVVVVTCGPDIQKTRVLERPGMTAEKFELVKSRQIPDAEKRRRADFIIDTGKGLDYARQAVINIIHQLTGKKS